jgi:hypothetical protein
MEKFKEYFISAALTFFTGFAIVVVGQIDSLSLASIADGSLVGLFFAATRTGIKGVLELFLALRAANAR